MFCFIFSIYFNAVFIRGVCRATALKIFLAVAFLLCEILLKISHIFFNRRVNASGRVDKNRGKIETVRPFEPSSTVVHPCTTVEGEFCACTKHRCCMEPPPSVAVLQCKPFENRWCRYLINKCTSVYIC